MESIFWHTVWMKRFLLSAQVANKSVILSKSCSWGLVVSSGYRESGKHLVQDRTAFYITFSLEKIWCNCNLWYSVMRELETKENWNVRNLSWDWTHNLLISRQALLLSETPNSLLVKECTIVLIPKLTSNLAVSNKYLINYTHSHYISKVYIYVYIYIAI